LFIDNFFSSPVPGAGLLEYGQPNRNGKIMINKLTELSVPFRIAVPVIGKGAA
jgi:hypothetical protein